MVAASTRNTACLAIIRVQLRIDLRLYHRNTRASQHRCVDSTRTSIIDTLRGVITIPRGYVYRLPLLPIPNRFYVRAIWHSLMMVDDGRWQWYGACTIDSV